MSYAKQKGTTFETSLVKYLIDCGFSYARRVTLHGGKDEGDIQLGEVNNPRFVIETKSYNREYNYKMIEDFVQEAPAPTRTRKVEPVETIDTVNDTLDDVS